MGVEHDDRGQAAAVGATAIVAERRILGHEGYGLPSRDPRKRRFGYGNP